MTRRREATNTIATYGWVERAFHWVIAVLILTALVLGKLAHDAGFDTDAALARKAWLFSFHKTVGVTIFLVALARIGWALSQPRPRPLHGGLEGFAAAAVHWLLYGSLVLVPLLGWSEHAAATGFAPIWWPFGQDLPFVPKDPELAKILATLHTTFVKVLVGALVLHIAGTLKHVLIDRDLTFARIWRGADPGQVPARGGKALPVVTALAVWAGTLVVALALVPEGTVAAPGQASVAGTSNWTVEGGTLSISVTQIGSAVTGSFADWQAAIDFDETPRDDGTLGTVEVSIATGSLTLGSVTTQAISGEFLASEAHPTARFDAVIRPDGADYLAEGDLVIRDASVPLTLPFTLQIEGDRAVMAGQVDLDRRDFGIGAAYPDESNVGFGVTVDVALTATRGAPDS
ncbi:cytochrome b/b6 domain-containing protein [Jannaschia sp. S6380]|uniref:cytochrome b/b6 domain-containing protein n=1 Tax=Jannaschia sp. S6380 TaxID=2926408 RepID=UPI001FF473B1|nr:cytochrome b/b6 domain-containing protein [Jannaschia sp. S6380]MCK0166909.1 cytochrome b/b6 domain-containing protein [Jannaschia sp. S6380]